MSTAADIKKADAALDEVRRHMAGLAHLPDPALIDPIIDRELRVVRAVVGNLVALGRVDPVEAFNDLEMLTPSGVREETHRNNR